MSSLENRRDGQGYRSPHLTEAVEFARFMGVIFMGAGVVVCLMPRMVMPRVDTQLVMAGAAALLITPGVLYVVAGVFLGRRHYWAWMTVTITTYILVGSVCGLLGWRLYSALADTGSVAGGPGEMIGMSMLGTGCGLTGLVVILHHLRKAGPEVREAEQVAREGFEVLAPVPVEAVETNENPRSK